MSLEKSLLPLDGRLPFDEIRYRGGYSKLFAAVLSAACFLTHSFTQAANKVDISVGGTKSEIISQASDPLYWVGSKRPNNGNAEFYSTIPLKLIVSDYHSSLGSVFHMGNSYNSDPWNASEVSSSLYQKIYGLKDGVEGNLEVADIYTPHGFEARINGSKGDKKILIPKMRM